MNLGDRLLWGMETYGVSTELFGATAYVGFNEALDPKDNYWYCDGTADEVQINKAITAAVNIKTVKLQPIQYYTANTVTLNQTGVGLAEAPLCWSVAPLSLLIRLSPLEIMCGIRGREMIRSLTVMD